MSSVFLYPTGPIQHDGGGVDSIIWRDSSDATYLSFTDAGNYSSVQLDAYAGGPITDVIVHYRAKVSVAPRSFQWSLYAADDDSSRDPIAQGADRDEGVPAAEVLTDSGCGYDAAGSHSLADIATALTTGAWLFPAPGTFLNTFTIYELSLEVVNSSSAPPLRRYPPVNNGGFGPTRHWPRTVNRRAGGTY